eukprot:m.85643 g.85643  ORF g.85643 m.85643 type:complete len:94 (-) comp12196_c1_seq1:1393-1674(-)
MNCSCHTLPSSGDLLGVSGQECVCSDAVEVQTTFIHTPMRIHSYTHKPVEDQVEELVRVNKFHVQVNISNHFGDGDAISASDCLRHGEDLHVR